MIENYADFPFHDTDPENQRAILYELSRKLENQEILHAGTKAMTRITGAMAIFGSLLYTTNPSEITVGVSSVGLAVSSYILKTHIQHHTSDRRLQAQFNFTDYERAYDNHGNTT